MTFEDLGRLIVELLISLGARIGLAWIGTIGRFADKELGQILLSDTAIVLISGVAMWCAVVATFFSWLDASERSTSLAAEVGVTIAHAIILLGGGFLIFALLFATQP